MVCCLKECGTISLTTSLPFFQDAFSAATLVADVKKPGFNGNIQYNPSTLEVLSGSDVRVFASGQRNPFDIVLHSNGLLYGTDNGPNNNFGDESTGCNTQDIDPVDKDELNLIEDGNYYGHPNRMRGASDPRQCVYRHFDDLQNNTPAIKKLPSSTNGICEFQTEHFGGQLRGQLIIGRYKGVNCAAIRSPFKSCRSIDISLSPLFVR